jgi:hypothetical protein
MPGFATATAPFAGTADFTVGVGFAAGVGFVASFAAGFAAGFAATAAAFPPVPDFDFVPCGALLTDADDFFEPAPVARVVVILAIGRAV